MKNMKKALPVPYILAATGALIYLSLIFNDNVWLDEAFTASLVRTNLAEVIKRSMNDTLPPLYNILLKAAGSLLGFHTPVMKLVSILPPVLLMWLSAFTLTKHYGTFVSSLYILCLFSMPQFLFYGVEIRMYSLGLFFVGACGIYALLLLQNPSRRNLVLTAVFAAGAGYTHHFALVSAGFIYLALLLYYLVTDRSRLRLWLSSAAAAFLLYLPCFLVTLKQIKSVSGYFSMPAITPAVFIKYLRYPYTCGNLVLTLLLAATVLLLVTGFLLRKSKPANEWFMIGYFLNYIAILCFGWLASKIMGNTIFVDRYLFPSFALLWLFFAVEAKKLGQGLKAALVILVCCCGITGYARQWTAEYDPGIKEMQAYFDQRLDAYDGYLIPAGEFETMDDVMECLLYYYPCLIPYYEGEAGIRTAEIDFTLEQEEGPADITGKRLWLLSGSAKPSLPKPLSALGYRLKPAGEFHFDRYHFYLYDLLPSRS